MRVTLKVFVLMCVVVNRLTVYSFIVCVNIY